MKKINKYMVLSLATCISLSPLMARANNLEGKDIIPISAPIDKNDTEDKIVADYIKYEGKIVEVNDNGKNLSVLVKDKEDEPYNGMLFHINEDVILLNNKSKEFITKDTLKKGMKVSAYYHKNTIMAMSMPPQLGPDIIVIDESEEPIFTHVSGFNKEFISSDGMLKINPSENTVIVDKDGKKIEKENIINRDLIVFYTISTKSIPAQTTPEKIIVMERKKEEKKNPEITVLDKIIINNKEITLNKKVYKNNKDVIMIPLRQISETLGYEIKWNGETKTAELIKGAQWTSVTIGQDNYNFAKMMVKLGTAPEMKDFTTYVPLNFLEEILKVEVEITENGIINIGK
ncbi:copper amine oxidase N-terminal domain-containing protein [Tissierella praeacuta]|uniref:copper amine oxidase N-terminal domain-containing protein n=1 Tax=Tissierella praeacuta TaxID=43131 RepID=UPI001C1131FF|nr:copper amine oxidase N-terminal domain-containing protein [Tissierella praeacuta]MBU5255406.1 copper amine oxidase N-terminal domain-containing protein [Tissierella praeacuta]